MKHFEIKNKFILFCRISLILLAFSVTSIIAQSTNVEFPTPISSDSINGKINPRDIGDARLTTHYYVFEGKQGDIFLKIEANNLNGDIDVFYADNLRPITKISLFSDSTQTQTGREIYLRQPEKMILRVQGRTLNDDAATYSIKFLGSFVAMAATETVEEPKLPEVKTETESDVKVNSVGTIIEVKPKEEEPAPKVTVAKTTRRRGVKATTTPKPVSTAKTPRVTKKKTVSKTEETPKTETKTEVAVTEDLPKTTENTETEKTETEKTETEKSESEKTETTAKIEPKVTKKKSTKKRTSVAKKAVEPKTPKPNLAAELAKALENVKLVVEFKDGGKLERPMNDILKFGVDKGVLTIINKDGSIGRYSILDVTKITVE